MDGRALSEEDWEAINKELSYAMSQAYLGNPAIEIQGESELVARSSFVELHSIRDGSPLYINLERVVLVASGENGSIIRTTSDTIGIPISESYEEVKQIIEGN